MRSILLHTLRKSIPIALEYHSKYVFQIMLKINVFISFSKHDIMSNFQLYF